jgi:serine/threonine-protein kinase
MDQLIANRYRLLELIGKGSMGKVYKARDIRLGHTVAVKFLSHTFQNSEQCDRFQTEAKACAQLGSKSN